jgi:hypothetical protein
MGTLQRNMALDCFAICAVTTKIIVVTAQIANQLSAIGGVL